MKIASFISFFLPIVVFAQSLEITEINFNPEGKDTASEYIEIRNTSSSSVDLDNFKINDGNDDTDHGFISDSDTSLIIPSNGIAVIYSSKQGLTASEVSLKFRASISIVNTDTRTYQIKDADGNTVHSIKLDPSQRPSGTHYSAHITDSGIVFANPTPGKAGSVRAGRETGGEASRKINSQSDSGGRGNRDEPKYNPLEKITSYIQVNTKDKYVNFTQDFNIIHKGEDGRKVSGVVALWNFGDGSHIKKTSNKNTTHIYRKPGKFVIAAKFNYKKDDYIVTKEIDIKNLEVFVKSYKGGVVVLRNEEPVIIDLSGWKIDGNKEVYFFSLGTIIAPNTELSFPINFINSKTLKLYTNKDEPIHFFPDLNNIPKTENKVIAAPVDPVENVDKIKKVEVTKESAGEKIKYLNREFGDNEEDVVNTGLIVLFIIILISITPLIIQDILDRKKKK